MARVSRPAFETPYLPIQGLNRDSNSLGVEPGEAVDMLNLRVFSDRVQTRSGTRRFAEMTPSEDPILHYHTYKPPNDQEILYAFTKNAIYKYDQSNDRWELALDYTVIDDCDRTPIAGETDLDVGILSNTTSIYEGTASIGAIETTQILLNDRIIGYDTFAAPLDLSGYSHVSLWMLPSPIQASEDLDLTIKFYDAGAYTTLIGSINFTLATQTVYGWQNFILELPAGTWTTVESYEIIAAENSSITSQLVQISLDYLIAFNPLDVDVNFWHSCDFVDDTYGATVVAAASNKPSPNVAESDYAARKIFFLDTSVTPEIFKEITATDNSMIQKLSVSNEATGVNAPAAAASATGDCDQLSGSEELIAGNLFSLATSKEGTLCRSSSILTTVDSSGAPGNGYLLLDVGDGNTTEGEDSSWVKPDGTWKITSPNDLTDGSSNAKLFVSYTYGDVVEYRPRFVWTFHDRLIMGNTCEGTSPNELYYPWRMRWGEVGDIFTASSVDYQDLVQNDTTGITGGDDMGFYLNIYKGESLLQVSYVGGASIFLAQTAWTPGTYAGRTIQTFQGRQYFLGDDDVYVWDGAERRSISINRRKGQHRVRDRIFELLNVNTINTCFACIFPKHQEYWLWITKIGETAPSSVFVYSILRDVWTYFEFPSCTTAGYFHIDTSAVNWDDLVGTWDEQNWTWDSASLEGLQKALILAYETSDSYVIDDTVGKDGGYVDAVGTYVDGTDIPTRITTRDFIYQDLPHRDRTTRLEFEGYWNGSVVIKVTNSYSLDPDTFKYPETLSNSPSIKTHKYFPDVVGEHVRFTLSHSGFVAYRWFIPYAIIEELHNQ